MKIQYGLDGKAPAGKAVPRALQYVFTVSTGPMTGPIVLAGGAGVNSANAVFLIQYRLFAHCTTALIQFLGIRIDKFQIGVKLPLVPAGSRTLTTPMVLFANDPGAGISGVLDTACLGVLLPFLLGSIVIDELYKYFAPVVTGSVVLAVGMCLILSAWNDMADCNPTGPDATKMLLVGIAIATICVIIDHFAKGIVRSLAVLIVMVVGYVFCSVIGIVDFPRVESATQVAVPRLFNFGMTVNLGAAITVFIIHIATIMENSGNTTGVVTTADESLPTKETLKASVRDDILDGVSPTLFNVLPTCVVTQNSDVEVIPGMASRFVTTIADVTFGLMIIFPKFSQVLTLIPSPVLGGILLVTFGNTIAGGIKVTGFDENNKRNFAIIALAAAVGISGNFAQAVETLAFFPSTVVTLFTGIPGTAIATLVLSVILPGEKKEEA